jgi:hypothetical protein
LGRSVKMPNGSFKPWDAVRTNGGAATRFGGKG